MQSLDVVYSPVCEASGAFLGSLEEWLAGSGLTLSLIPADRISARELEWYRSAGLCREDGGLKDSIFIDLFFSGRLIDSVPLNKKKIAEATGIKLNPDLVEQLTAPENFLSITQFRRLILSGEIRWKPLTRENYSEEMSMCLENYPHGNPPRRFHQGCRQLKEKVFEEVFHQENIAGIYGTWSERVIGLLEVFPREILAKYGFLTGTGGCNGKYLTVGCFEVGHGVPRKEMLDELMFQLELIYPRFRRPYLEGVGVFEWREGFTPYWVYDKYGFTRSEQITHRKVIMEKKISED